MEFNDHTSKYVDYLCNIEINHVYLSIIRHLFGGYSLIFNDVRNDYYSCIMSTDLEHLIKRISSYARNLQKESN